MKKNLGNRHHEDDLAKLQMFPEEPPPPSKKVSAVRNIFVKIRVAGCRHMSMVGLVFGHEAVKVKRGIEGGRDPTQPSISAWITWIRCSVACVVRDDE